MSSVTGFTPSKNGTVSYNALLSTSAAITACSRRCCGIWVFNSGKSILPVGVKEVRGDFTRGDMVICVDLQGKEIARGLINYHADEARKIIGKPSSQIADVLGYRDDNELIHRDNLVLS